MNLKYIYLFIFILLWPSIGRADDPSPAAKELYQTERYKEVVDALRGKSDQNAEQALYLGLSYLRLGDQSRAIDAWKNYVRLAPGGEGERDISKYLTLLLQEEAKRSAREMLQQEKRLSFGKVDAKAIAVSPFQNLGKEIYAPLSKGLAEMVITDLSKVKTLRVVERIQLQAILNEMKLSQSGLVDGKSAPRVGKLLGAGKITTGSYLDFEEEKIRLDAALLQTETGKLLTSPQVTGALTLFYQLEKTLVYKILCGVGQCPEGLDGETKKEVEAIHTKNFKAFRLYSEGLNALDQGNYREASRSFYLAVEEDPEFDLARKALLDTPLFPLDLAAMISGAEKIGAGGIAIVSTERFLTAPRAPEKTIEHEILAPSIGVLTPGTLAPPAAPTAPVQIHVQF